MDTGNPYQSPATVQASPSSNALRALRGTRWILWLLMLLAGLSVPYTILACLGSLWAARFFDDSRGYYTASALLELTAIPVACVCLWQFFRFDRALRRVATEGQFETLLFAQKQLFLVVSLTFVGYWLIRYVGGRLLLHLAG